MGIRGLESFIKRNGISEEISICHEIRKWRREHTGTERPTIVVDLKEFARTVATIDDGGMIFGTRLDEINKIISYFFGEIKKAGADLMFVCRLYKGCFKDRFHLSDPDLGHFDCIKDHEDLKSYLDSQRRLNPYSPEIMRPHERLMFNLIILCRNYGEVVSTSVLGRRTVLSYARRSNVLAVITRDTEFLMYEGTFQFWSVARVKFRYMEIVRFCREKLGAALELNIHQMKLLFIMTQFKKLGKSKPEPIWKVVEYVKQQQCGPEGYNNMAELTGRYTEEQIKEMNALWTKLTLIDNHCDFRDGDIYDEFLSELIQSDENFKTVVEFCKSEPRLYFVYELMNKSWSIQQDVLFTDFRRWEAPDFLGILTDIALRQCGTIFKDIDTEKRPTTRTVLLITDGTTEFVEQYIKYPPKTLNLPSLEDIIVKEEDDLFANSRWNLFQWLLDFDEKTVSKIKRSTNSEYIRIAKFTLEILLKNELINAREADVILMTEVDSQSKRNVHVSRTPPMPSNVFPNYVDIDWVITAHQYTIVFETICHCLEICGLRKKTSLILFNAMKFHENMRKGDSGDPNFDDMLQRVEHLRLK